MNIWLDVLLYVGVLMMLFIAIAFAIANWGSDE